MADQARGFCLETATIPIRALPANSYLVHATNCIATWGAGIAAELASIFPAACKQYEEYCNSAKSDPTARWPPRSLAGRCLITPPQKSDVDAGAPPLHIVCLFTSYGFGAPNKATGKPGKDGANTILSQTETSVKAFREQLRAGSGTDEGSMVIYSPMFNSGAFKVPWQKSANLIEATFEGWNGRWAVLTPLP